MKSTEEIKSNKKFLVRNISKDGGIGELYVGGKPYASVIWSNGGGWEHVSISPYNRRHTPTWDEMCNLKDMFFKDDEVVVQYHPAKSEYVNNMPNCLHLWRPIIEKMPTPPAIMVGVKQGQSAEDVRKSIKELLGFNGKVHQEAVENGICKFNGQEDYEQ